MKLIKKLTTILALGIAMISEGSLISRSYAAEVPFAVRYSVTMRGKLDAIGNTNRTNSGLVDIDSDGGTTNSSSADLTIPSGASVNFAALYWTGTSADTDARSVVKFKAPGSSSYTSLTADTAAVDNNVINYYSHFKDVTALVTAAGSGTYAVADIVSNNEMGWALFVILADASESPKTMVIYDGSLRVSSGMGFDDRSISVSGFLTPPSGTVNASVGIFSVQGQDNIPGDGAIFAGTTLSDALNPSNNYFNGTYTIYGAHLGNKNPDTTAHQNIDLDLIAVNGALGNSVNSTTFRFTSSGDFYIPSVLTISIDTYEPSFASTFSKAVVDVNAGTVEPGDTLYYEFLVRNAGNDTATGVVFSDVIPTGMAYVPGSLEIVSGTGTGVKTDASGDDIAEVSGSTVTFRLGTGATSSAGGSFNVGDEVKFRFAAKVNNATMAGASLSNAASLSFVGLSSASSYTAQSEAIIGGANGDALVLTVGSAQPTPAFTPFTAQGAPTPTPSATPTAVPSATATAAPTATPTIISDSCPLVAPTLTRRGSDVRVNFRRGGNIPRDYKIILRRTRDGAERRTRTKAGKELPFFKKVAKGEWTAQYIEIRNRKVEVCSKKKAFTIK